MEEGDTKKTKNKKQNELMKIVLRRNTLKLQGRNGEMEGMKTNGGYGWQGERMEKDR